MTSHLFRSFFEMNGTASRKRGWLVFGVCTLAVVAFFAVEIMTPRAARWLFPLLGVLTAVQTVAVVQRLHDAGRSGYWALLSLVPLLGLAVAVIINTLAPKPGVFTPPGHTWAQRLGYLGLVAFAALTIARSFTGVYWIPSGSMKPALLVGDYLLVPHVRADQVQRGDILVFHHPVNNSDYIKRVIGLPGDTVQMKNGAVILNGAELPQSPLPPFVESNLPQGPSGHTPRCETVVPDVGAECVKSMALETLPGGPSYGVLNIQTNGPADNGDAQTVPPGHWFFIGDNRDNSIDSRFAQAVGGLGFVPFENAIGRGSRVVFSAAGTSLLDVSSWRPGRYWKALQ